MHCRHRNKEIVTVSVKVINNYASKSKIMTNESKIHIDQIKSIKDVALMHLFINKLPGFCSSILALINNEQRIDTIERYYLLKIDPLID